MLLSVLSMFLVSAEVCMINGDVVPCQATQFIFPAIVIACIVIAIAAFAIFLIVFWILMLVDCIQRDFKKDEEKIIWILILILTHILGAVIYYFMVKREQKLHKRKKR